MFLGMELLFLYYRWFLTTAQGKDGSDSRSAEVLDVWTEELIFITFSTILVR